MLRIYRHIQVSALPPIALLAFAHLPGRVADSAMADPASTQCVCVFRRIVLIAIACLYLSTSLFVVIAKSVLCVCCLTASEHSQMHKSCAVCCNNLCCVCYSLCMLV